MSEKRKKRKKKEKTKFLIDYDLPEKDKCRQQFYRKLKNPEFKGTKSTRSVVLTGNPRKAAAIYKKASKCRKSNLYIVKKTKTIIPLLFFAFASEIAKRAGSYLPRMHNFYIPFFGINIKPYDTSLLLKSSPMYFVWSLKLSISTIEVYSINS